MAMLVDSVEISLGSGTTGRPHRGRGRGHLTVAPTQPAPSSSRLSGQQQTGGVGDPEQGGYNAQPDPPLTRQPPRRSGRGVGVGPAEDVAVTEGGRAGPKRPWRS
jgi:hypothetical protein